jgi:iron complex transport system permease protein
MKDTGLLRLAGKQQLLFLMISVLLFTFFILDILFGSVLLPFRQVIGALFSPDSVNDSVKVIVHDFRIPKALTAISAGIALSISGLQMQTVFRNPLAGPYVLGISAGASLAVALFALGFSSYLLAGYTFFGTWTIAMAAWIGSFLVMLLVLAVSAKVNDNVTILILGLLFSAAAGALVNILQYFSSEALLKSFIVWTMGSLGSITKGQLAIVIPAILIGTIVAFAKVKDMNAFLLGETYARSLGVNVNLSRLVIFASASLLTGTITAFCGPIGFIGIAVPHLARVMFRNSDHRILLPATLLIGADAMLLSDIISQMPGLHTTLPINSVTALLGIPVVVWMIIRNKKFAFN